MPKILVIFLAYYSDYAKAALASLESMLKMSGAPYDLIIVNNGPAPLLFEHPATTIEGNNLWNEFSGWQSGLLRAQSKGDLARYAGIVLANDTIGHHNRFGLVSRYAFARALKSITETTTPKAAGECWDFYTDFEVAGHRGRRWITSSLLMVNRAACAALTPLVPPDIEVPTNPDSCFESFHVNDALKRQVQGWLGLIKLPAGKPLWYGTSTDQTPDYTKKIAKKAAMILLEYRLSARLAEHDTELIEVFGHSVLRNLRRLEGRPTKVSKAH